MMEGKILILSVLLTSLAMVQIQVEAKSCCPTQSSREIYNLCRVFGASPKTCASGSGCTIVDGPCPYDRDILQNTGDIVSQYCKLGCVSSVCGALTTLQNSDASEMMNRAVEKCTKACCTLCNKNFVTASESA